jgi:diketogulonate reductase-like aldo/keto reductase
MKQRFGLTQREVPMVGQGTWYPDDGPHPVAVAALRAGLHLGMTQIDKADMYGEAHEPAPYPF